ncbi:FBP domain-containing protein [Glutamicibacter endophyticus]
MQPLSEKTIRSSFINASRQEAKKLNLPENFNEIDWENIEYLGWRDPKMPQRGYLLFTDAQGTTRGLLMRTSNATRRPGSAAMCEMCRDVTLPCPVVLFSTRRAGQAGREGDTLGTMICSEFQCSANVRVAPPKDPINPDPMLVVAQRIAELPVRVDAFIRRVLGESTVK